MEEKVKEGFLDDGLDERTAKQLWSILDSFLAENWSDHEVYGLPHIRRVYANFKIFRESRPAVSPDILQALECAVILHDIGRCRPGDHAANSAAIIRSLVNEGLTLPQPEWIIYAVENHSKGLGGRYPADEKDICLGLLVLFNHMDAIGSVGIYRTIKAMQIPLIPKPEAWDDLKEKIALCLDTPEEIDTSYSGMKNSSIIEHLAYNFAATAHIVKPVEYLLNAYLVEEILNRVEMVDLYIADLLFTASEGWMT